MKQLRITTFVAAVALVAMINIASLAVAEDETSKFKAKLDGYQETPQAISTPGRGRFKAEVKDNETKIEIELTYSGLEGMPTPPNFLPLRAHIHLARPGVTGCVVIPLCGTTTPLMTPACPASPGTVIKTLTAADVIACTTGGIAAGQLGEVIKAMHANATYVNVHNDTYPSGEIRGAIKEND